MKRFDFRLERILGLRRSVSRQKAQACAEALAELRLAERDVVASERAVADAKKMLAQALDEKSVDTRAICSLHDCLATLERQAVAAELRRAERESEYRARQDDLAHARRDALTLEKARGKAFDEWKEQATREELAAIEETTQARYVRQQAENRDEP